MRFEQAVLLPAICAVLCSGCKKEEANGQPHVAITSPADGASLTVPDTLILSVQATDDIGLEQVSVTLLDQNQVPVLSPVGSAASGKSASFTLALPIASELLPSGDYTLYAAAYDGDLIGNDSQTLHITAAPLRVRAVYTVVHPGGGTTALYRTDSAGQTTLATSSGTDFGGAAVSSAAQRLFIAGGATGNLQAIAMDAPGTAWQLPNLGSLGEQWFTSIDLCADGRLYVGQADGTLRGFNARNGTGTFNTTLQEQFRATQSITSGELVICTEHHFVTQEQRIGIYFLASGALQQTQPLDMEPMRIFDREGEHLLIFGNRNGEGVVQDRTIIGGGGWEPYTWPSPITAVERVAQGTWLVALSNGDLQRFTFGNAGSLSIATTPVLNTMAFNEVNGSVYGGADGQVLLIDPSTGAVVPAWSVAGDVRKVLPLLNR